jgi:hypothetical protein
LLWLLAARKKKLLLLLRHRLLKPPLRLLLRPLRLTLPPLRLLRLLLTLLLRPLRLLLRPLRLLLTLLPLLLLRLLRSNLYYFKKNRPAGRFFYACAIRSSFPHRRESKSNALPAPLKSFVRLTNLDSRLRGNDVFTQAIKKPATKAGFLLAAIPITSAHPPAASGSWRRFPRFPACRHWSAR